MILFSHSKWAGDRSLCTSVHSASSTLSKMFAFTAFMVVIQGVATAQISGVSPAMLASLESRTAERPDDAGAWRLLGRAYLKNGNWDGAQTALTRALEIDPKLVAAHSDMADLFLARQMPDQAAAHFSQVVLLAPDSEYAEGARARLGGLPPPPLDNPFMQAGYKIRSFDGSDTIESIEPHESSELSDELNGETGPIIGSRWSAVIEAGSLYNSNVTLTPNSRDFFAAEAASAQLFFNPDVEYRWFDDGVSRAGATFAGYFGVNESTFSDLDLQSYRPGVFAERSIAIANGELVPRLSYDYTLDQFSGQTFSNRHAVTASLASHWDWGQMTILNWTVDHTDFPALIAPDPESRRDGWSHRLGGYHSWDLDQRWIDSIGVGGEYQWVDAAGDDFAFHGTTLYGDITIPLMQRVDAILEGGGGYRDYYRSGLDPSRDEAIWRGGAKIRFRLNQRWSFSTVFNYDRFSSKNADFDARRYLAGLVTTWVY
jgi:tetratricopeptide (TPR) repeat protein